MEAKKLYNALYELGKQKIDADIEVKIQEEDIRYKFADAMNLTDKDNQVKVSLVKMPLLKSAISVVFEEEDDKKTEEYEIYEEYMAQLENGIIPKEGIDKLFRLREEVAGVKEEIKFLKNDALTTEEDDVALEKDDVKKVEELLKEPLAKYKLDKENEYRAENGQEEKTLTVRMTIDELIAFANENDIEITIRN